MFSDKSNLATIRDFPVSEADPKMIIGKELLATVASVLLFPFGMRATKTRMPRAADQRTVVFVHGYLANRSSLMPLAGYLKARGIKAQLSYEYSSRHGIEHAAIGLKAFLKKHVRGGRIDLVCHSLGGLVARIYVQELGGARRVDNVITLGSPHWGTYNAYWVPSRVGRELRPDSPLLARMNAPRGPHARVRCLSIVGGSDNIVIPRVFGQSHEEVVHVPNLGHMGLLFSPAVFQAVATRLKDGANRKP